MLHTTYPSAAEDRLRSADADFQRATARLGEIDQRFHIGDQVVRMRFAGRQLADVLTPALAHLACGGAGFDESTDLSIDVWESAVAPVTMPQADWLRAVSPLEAFGPRDFVYLQPDIGMLTLLCGNRALVCFREAAAIPTWEIAMPFRVTLNAWFQRQGGQIVHGAAVANDRHAVILAGRGGSGKSSTALSCLAAPSLRWMGDDLCLLQGDRQPTVCSLYNSLKLWRDNLPRFDDLPLPTRARSSDYWEKPTFFLYPQYQQELARRRPVKAILLPRITGGPHTRIAAATAGDAWRALVPSTATVVIGDQQRSARNMVRFVSRLPAYWLELGDDRERIVRTLERFLGDAAWRAA